VSAHGGERCPVVVRDPQLVQGWDFDLFGLFVPIELAGCDCDDDSVGCEECAG